MKAKWKRFREIIGDPNMPMVEKYGRLIAHIEKIEAELRERLVPNHLAGLDDFIRSTFIKEILGIE